jgi:Hydantoinase/oxoprolinase
MQSDGGLVDVSKFSGLRAILSGPAGGVVGYALTSYDPETKIPVIGFDMGGTSTGMFCRLVFLCQMFRGMQGDMNMFLRRRLRESRYRVLNWILILLQPEVDLACFGRMDYLLLAQKVQVHILDQLVTGTLTI